jgi:hypothetical protein
VTEFEGSVHQQPGTPQQPPTRRPAGKPDAARVATRRRRAVWVGALVVAGFLLRIGFGLGYWVGKPLMKDEQEYLLLATRLALGHGFSYPPPVENEPAPRRFERPPGFAAFLAAVLTFTNDPLLQRPFAGTDKGLPASSSEVPVFVKVAQSAVGSLGIIFIAALAGRAAGHRAATVAAAVAAVYPPLVWMCGYVLSEPLYSTLALATVWLLQTAADPARRAHRWIGVAAGLLAGSSLLTKEAMLFFLPLASLWLMYTRKYALAVAFWIGVTAVAVPWIMRNFAVHGQFVLTASHGGVTLWTGNNPLAIGEGDLAANPTMGEARVALEDSYPGFTNQQLDAIYYREVAAFIREQPGRWLVLEAKKLFYTFVPVGPSYRLHSARYYGASLISYGFLLPFALAGIWALVRRGEPSRLWALWLIALSMVVVSLVFFPQERFRIPVLDPAAIVAAGIFAGLRPRS